MTSAFAAAIPVLRVQDVARAMAWYVDHLGFSALPSPEVAPHDHCVLRRDQITLLLRRRSTPVENRSSLALTDWDVYLQLDGGALLDVLDTARRRTPLVRGPELMPDGMVEFELEDPDGHRICLAERLADTRGFPPAV